MNNAQKQEKRELFYLRAFLKRMEIEPQRTERGENPPDFYLVCGSVRIAVEITEYHSQRKGPGNHSWRMVEEAWQEIKALFVTKRQQYPALDEVHGFLYFKDLEMPSSGQYEEFVDELLKFGMSELNVLTEERTLYHCFPATYLLLNRYLKKMHLQKVGCHMTWGMASATYVGISEQELERAIFRKLKKPRPPRIDEYWLLIVSGTHMSQNIGLTGHEIFNNFTGVNKKIQASCFDKVIFFQYIYERILCWNRNKQWEQLKAARFSRDSLSNGQPPAGIP